MPFLFRCHYSSFTKTNLVTVPHVQGDTLHNLRDQYTNCDVICNDAPNARKNRWIVYGTWRWQRCQPYITAAFNPQEIPGWVDSSAIVRPKGHHRESNQRPPACSAVPQPPEPPRPSVYWPTHTYTKYIKQQCIRFWGSTLSEMLIMNCQLRVSYGRRKNASF